ncbi:unnamed protein product [Gadus morhua 'NCC']
MDGTAGAVGSAAVLKRSGERTATDGATSGLHGQRGEPQHYSSRRRGVGDATHTCRTIQRYYDDSDDVSDALRTAGGQAEASDDGSECSERVGRGDEVGEQSSDGQALGTSSEAAAQRSTESRQQRQQEHPTTSISAHSEAEVRGA